MEKIIKKIPSDKITLCFDRKRLNFRNNLYEVGETLEKQKTKAFGDEYFLHTFDSSNESMILLSPILERFREKE